MTRGLLNVRGVITFMVGGVYLGGLVWALVAGQLDIKSYVAGIGPVFGLIMSYWFNQDKSEQVMTEKSIEQQIQDKGLTAPRITPDHINAVIDSEWYINGANVIVPDGFMPPVPSEHPLERLTICVLVLRNGFMVTGESACASPENFDQEIGRQAAREKAIEKIGPLEGYLLRQRLSEAG